MIEPLVVDALFPRGIAHYALGGVLIGLGTAIIYVGTGIHAGASTFLESTLSYVSNEWFYQRMRIGCTLIVSGS
jgi:uncharacterized membrane protein YczE